MRVRNPRSVVWLWLFLVPLAVFARERAWRKVTAPHFTVITTTSDRQAVDWAMDFAEFVAGFQQYIHINPDRLPPLTIVLFSDASDFEPYRPIAADGKPEDVAGYFSRRESWAVAGLAGLDLDAETRRTVFHEGTHWIMSADELPNPVWLEEGIAEVFSTFTIEGKEVRWGEPIADHVISLRGEALMPLEKLLLLARNELFTGGDSGAERTSMTYAESWLFVHYLMFGRADAPKRALANYVQLLRTMDLDKAFSSAFGHDYAEVDRQLSTYLHDGKYYVVRTPRVVVTPLKAELATPAEVEEALARLAVAGGHRDLAEQHAQRFAALKPDDPKPYELLGAVAEEYSDNAAAVTQYKKGIERNSQDYRPYFVVASAEHHADEDMDGTVRGLTEQEARRLVDAYEKAIRLNPRFRPAYSSMAGLIAGVAQPTPEDLQLLAQGHKLFPDDGAVRIGLAQLDYRAGHVQEARQALAAIETLTPRPPANVIRFAQRLADSWNRNGAGEQLKALVAAKKYGEAVTLIDHELGTSSDPAYRMQLTILRREYEAHHKLQLANAARQAHHWVEVRRLLTEIVDSDASPYLKNQAKLQLRGLDQMGVGLSGSDSGAAGSSGP